MSIPGAERLRSGLIQKTKEIVFASAKDCCERDVFDACAANTVADTHEWTIRKEQFARPDRSFEKVKI